MLAVSAANRSMWVLARRGSARGFTLPSPIEFWDRCAGTTQVVSSHIAQITSIMSSMNRPACSTHSPITSRRSAVRRMSD